MATVISDAAGLQNMDLNLASDYVLGNDIDASATVGWNGGLGFDPIGTVGAAFTGSFDGGFYKIKDLVVNRPAEDYNGLFGHVQGSVIQNVTLEGGSITGQNYTGGLIGRLNENLAGWPTVIPYTILNCHSDLPIIGEQATGGLIALVVSGYEPCLIEACSAIGNVTDIRVLSSNAGGLIGNAFLADEHLTVKRCFATGNVSAAGGAANDAGGFIGTSNDIRIEDCYALGNVVASVDGGGFISSPFLGPHIKNCYSKGTVAGANIGGFAGGSAGSGVITKCFWDITTSGQATSVGGTGKTTVQMKTLETFQEANWGISREWNVLAYCNSGYPCLIGVNICCAARPKPVDQTVIGSKVSLEAIRNLEIVYGGRFYINKSGNATYESRYHRQQ